MEDIMSSMIFEFDNEIKGSAKIKVLGVGGGGCNALDSMIDFGVKGVEFIAFEDKGWNHFKKFKPKNSAWDNGFYITKVIDEVDHIINLPRISSHIMAGVTLGTKNLVGLLREDSRIEFHNDGPWPFSINYFAGFSYSEAKRFSKLPSFSGISFIKIHSSPLLSASQIN